MPYDPETHYRRSVRLPGYDYSQPGKYYVTICTQNKEHLFGQIIEGEMQRNQSGERAGLCWKWLARQYAYVDLDEWVIMPNHLHGIIVITDGRGGSRAAPTAIHDGRGGASRGAPSDAHSGGATDLEPGSGKRKPLGGLVGAFKTVSTNDINEIRGTPASQFWQRGFYEHIIRNDGELNIIREYIRTNPQRWGSDPENT